MIFHLVHSQSQPRIVLLFCADSQMMAASRLIMVPMLLLPLLYHPVAEAVPLEGLTDIDYEILANFLSAAFMESNSPSPDSSFEVIASNDNTPGVVTHSISPDDFKIGYAVEGTFLAPDKGRVHLDLIDDEGGKSLLHLDARYKSPGAGYSNTLIVNANINGWGQEKYLSGYDFTPGVLVTLRVEAKDGHFCIIVNGQELGTFKYRVPDVTSVSRIQLRYSDNRAKQKAELQSLSIHYQ